MKRNHKTNDSQNPGLKDSRRDVLGMVSIGGKGLFMATKPIQKAFTASQPE
jgi:hypothetical protein